MSFYSTTNNQTTRKIYNIIDDLEQRLSNRNKSRKKYVGLDNENYSNYPNEYSDRNNSYYQRPQLNAISNNDAYYQPLNTNQSQIIPQNLIVNQSTDLDIRKIIKEEFSTLIIPYQTDLNNNINMLQVKINNILNDYQNENNKLRSIPNINKVDNQILEIKNILSEYNNKIKELEDQIASNLNNLNIRNNSIQAFDDKLNNEIKNINQNIQELKMKNQDYNNRFNNFINNYDNEMTTIKQNYNKLLTNEIKLNDTIDKNSFLQKNFDALKEENNNFKNSINLSLSEKNQKLNDLENKQNNLNNKINDLENNQKNLNNKINDFESKNKKFNEEMNNMNNNLINMTTSINNLKDKTFNFYNNDNNNTNNNDSQINELKNKIDKLNINDLLKIDINKINSINDKYEEFMSNNEKLFQILEQHNTTITDLNTKLNRLREDYENESKKKYNQINERISKVEDESKDRISRNSNINITQREKENTQNEINLINDKLNDFNRRFGEMQNELQNITSNQMNYASKISSDNKIEQESKINGNEINSNEILNIKNEIEKVNNKIINLENEIIYQELPNIKKNIEEINKNNLNNDNDNLLQEITKIKEDIQNINTSMKKNNYMLTIANIKNEIDKIKETIQKYHYENENNNREGQYMPNEIDEIDNGQENIDNIIIDKNFIDDNNKNQNENQDMIDLMASENSQNNPPETFLTNQINNKNYENNNDLNDFNKRENNIYNFQSNNNDNNNDNFLNNNNINFNNNEEKNDFDIKEDLTPDNKPIGEAPIPTGKEPIKEDSRNSLDDFEIEDI